MSDLESVFQSQFSEKARQDRVEHLRQKTGKKLNTLNSAGIEPSSVRGHVENYIGTIQIPMGLVGPLLVNFSAGPEKIYAPIATTEGALISSMNRAALAITLSGGCTARVISNRMIRAPQFEFENLSEALYFSKWIESKKESLQQKVKDKSKFAELLELDCKIFGKTVHIRFIFDTGDAAGQNMTTFVTNYLCHSILQQAQYEKNFKIKNFVIEGNLSSDKKVSALSASDGRGRSVVAEVVIKESVLKRILNNSCDQVIERFQRSKSARIFTGMNGYNINVANAIAGIFLSTGQDMACVHESSVAELHLEKKGADLYACLYLPAIVVGTVGGGVSLPGPKDSLEMINCYGLGKANRFAEIIASLALGLELSTLCSIVSGQFTEAHEELGRKIMMPWLKEGDIDLDFFQRSLALDKNEKITKAYALPNLNFNEGHITDLASNVSKKFCGLYGFKISSENENQIKQQNIFLKVKPKDSEIFAGAIQLLNNLDKEVAQLLTQYKTVLPFQNCHVREIEFAQFMAVGASGSLKSMMPKILGTVLNNEKEQYILVQQLLENVLFINSVQTLEDWTIERQTKTLECIARFHSHYSQNNIEYFTAKIPSLLHMKSADLAKAEQLWSGLYELSYKLENTMTGVNLFWSYYEDCILNYKIWVAQIDQQIKTLIHNDFNPRNIAFLKDAENPICVYDWEFVSWGMPQKDLAEFLMFTLAPDFTIEEFNQLMTTYLIEYNQNATRPMSFEELLKGFKLALKDFVVHRMPFYFVISQVEKCDYVERIIRTMNQFIKHYENK